MHYALSTKRRPLRDCEIIANLRLNLYETESCWPVPRAWISGDGGETFAPFHNAD